MAGLAGHSAAEGRRIASSWDYGVLVPRGTGLVQAYVHYALWNGTRWETFGEWTPFQTRLGYRSDLCRV